MSRSTNYLKLIQQISPMMMMVMFCCKERFSFPSIFCLRVRMRSFLILILEIYFHSHPSAKFCECVECVNMLKRTQKADGERGRTQNILLSEPSSIDIFISWVTYCVELILYLHFIYVSERFHLIYCTYLKE